MHLSRGQGREAKNGRCSCPRRGEAALCNRWPTAVLGLV